MAFIPGILLNLTNFGKCIYALPYMGNVTRGIPSILWFIGRTFKINNVLIFLS